MASVENTPGDGSTRAHSIENRTAFWPESATSFQSSANRCHESMASPLGSAAFVSGACSCSHQSVLVLLPSDWCAAMAEPHRNPSGNARAPIPARSLDHALLDALVPVLVAAHPVPVRERDARAGLLHLRHAVVPRALRVAAGHQEVAPPQHERARRP